MNRLKIRRNVKSTDGQVMLTVFFTFTISQLKSLSSTLFCEKVLTLYFFFRYLKRKKMGAMRPYKRPIKVKSSL